MNNTFRIRIDQLLKYPRKTVTWWTWAKLNCYRRWHHAILKTGQTIWKSRIWAFRGALMCNSSFVVARVMHFFIHTNQCFNCLIKITKTQYLFDQIAHISAYDKARTSHESSPKSSDSNFSDDLNSFQNFLMLAPVTVQSSRCPPCNSFSRIFQSLTRSKYPGG